MSAKRYGIFIPPYGYVYDGATWGDLRFTPDATKGCLGKSYVKVAEALEAINAIKRREEYKDAQLAVYKVQATAEVENVVDAKEQVQASRKVEFAGQVEEYKGLKATYDAMPGKELDKLPEKKWKYYQALERKLRLLELI